MNEDDDPPRDGASPGSCCHELTWLTPAHQGTPAQALTRIRSICERVPDLYGAMMAVQFTHAQLPRDLMARAIRQFRPDAASLGPQDIAGLLAAGWNGGRQGFDAVLRTRKDAAGKPRGGLPSWVSRD